MHSIFRRSKSMQRRWTMNTRTMLRESDALPRRTSIRGTCTSGRSLRRRVREGRTTWNRIWGLRGQTKDDSTHGWMLEKASSSTPSFKALSRLSNVVNFRTTISYYDWFRLPSWWKRRLRSNQELERFNRIVKCIQVSNYNHANRK